jgi:hypothetical protein
MLGRQPKLKQFTAETEKSLNAITAFMSETAKSSAGMFSLGLINSETYTGSLYGVISMTDSLNAANKKLVLTRVFESLGKGSGALLSVLKSAKEQMMGLALLSSGILDKDNPIFKALGSDDYMTRRRGENQLAKRYNRYLTSIKKATDEIDQTDLDARNPSPDGAALSAQAKLTIARLQKELDGLKTKRDLIDEANDGLKRQYEYQQKLMQLSKDATQAKISGDYIGASIIEQQKSFEATQFNKETDSLALNKKITALENRISALNANAKVTAAEKKLNDLTKKDVSPIKKAVGGYIRHYGEGSTGGVKGPGTGTSDSIPAYLSNGEYVIKADSVKKYGVGTFDALNAQKFADGGIVNLPGYFDEFKNKLKTDLFKDLKLSPNEIKEKRRKENDKQLRNLIKKIRKSLGFADGGLLNLPGYLDEFKNKVKTDLFKDLKLSPNEIKEKRRKENDKQLRNLIKKIRKSLGFADGGIANATGMGLDWLGKTLFKSGNSVIKNLLGFDVTKPMSKKSGMEKFSMASMLIPGSSAAKTGLKATKLADPETLKYFMLRGTDGDITKIDEIVAAAVNGNKKNVKGMSVVSHDPIGISTLESLFNKGGPRSTKDLLGLSLMLGAKESGITKTGVAISASADRSMYSEALVKGLERRGLGKVIGLPERNSSDLIGANTKKALSDRDEILKTVSEDTDQMWKGGFEVPELALNASREAITKLLTTGYDKAQFKELLTIFSKSMKEKLNFAMGGLVPGYKDGGSVKDGWLQKWAKSLSGQPGAEMMGTAPILRLLSGMGSKGDKLGAAMAPLSFAGMGIGSKIGNSGGLMKALYSIPNKIYQARNQAKVNSMIKSGMWHGSQPTGSRGEDYLQGTNILDGAESNDPYYGMGFFGTSSKAEADLYAGGYNSSNNWGSSFGSMNNIVGAPKGKYIDFTRGTNSLKWQDYSLAKALGVKRNGYIGDYMPENLGEIMSGEGMTGAIMNRVNAGYVPKDIAGAKWLSWNNPAGVITKEKFANGGLVRGPGTTTSDSIMAKVGYAKGGTIGLSNKEYVVKAAAVKKYGTGFMDAINEQKFGAGFKDSISSQKLSSIEPVKQDSKGDVVYNNYVTVNGTDLNKKEVADEVIMRLNKTQKQNNKSNMVTY